MTAAQCPVSFPAEMSLAEAVQIEALASVARRELARQTGTVVMAPKGPTAKAFRYGDQIRALAAELDRAEALALRNEEMNRLATPSGLIAEMRRKWPGQAAQVKAYAKAQDIPLGEAWAKVIAAGCASLRTRRR